MGSADGGRSRARREEIGPPRRQAQRSTSASQGRVEVAQLVASARSQGSEEAGEGQRRGQAVHGIDPAEAAPLIRHADSVRAVGRRDDLQLVPRERCVERVASSEVAEQATEGRIALGRLGCSAESDPSRIEALDITNRRAVRADRPEAQKDRARHHSHRHHADAARRAAARRAGTAARLPVSDPGQCSLAPARVRFRLRAGLGGDGNRRARKGTVVGLGNRRAARRRRS